MTKVSIIMPAYNRETFIGAALESLLAQSDACDLDILVVNDGSTDATAQVVEAIAGKHGRVRMVTTENGGVARARNIGLDNLPDDCEFVTFLDSDDISPPGRLASDLAVFAEYPGTDFTYGFVTLVDDIDPQTREPSAGARVERLRGISFSAALFSRPFVPRVGRIDESFLHAEDTDFLFRAFEISRNCVMTQTNTVYYRRHAGNMTLDTATGRKHFMRAMHRSIQRRRADPTLRVPDQVFGIGFEDGVRRDV